MREVAAVVRAMGLEQLFLALVYLCGYSLALGEFVTARGRRVAVAAAVCAAAAFAILSNPWEGGVVLVGFASVGLAVFSAAAWMIWRATTPRLVLARAQDPSANLARTWPTPSSRSTNTAPILNSPAAE